MAKKTEKNLIPELKAQIKENRLHKLYVFYGEEEYLKEYYIKQIEEKVPTNGFDEFNRILIQGGVDYDVYDSVLESMPVMAEKRIVEIRDSNIFTMKRSGGIVPPDDEQKKFWQDKFKRLSEDTVLIFCEKNVDGRSVLFKTAAKAGFAVEFKYMSANDLRAWAVRRAVKAGKKMDNSVADYLISVIDPGMNNLENEMNKLLNYSGEIIYKSDIDKVVSRALQVQAFDITDALMAGDARKALSVLGDMRTQKQSVFAILYLIYSNVEKMLHLRLAGVTSRAEAAETLGCAPWLAGKYLDGSKGFSSEKLYYMVTRVPEIDYEIKSGAVEEWQALEQYIFNIVNRETGGKKNA